MKKQNHKIFAATNLNKSILKQTRFFLFLFVFRFLGQKWKSRRKMITPAFHYSILKEFVNIFEVNADILVEKLKTEIGNNSVDIYPYISLFTLDVIYGKINSHLLCNFYMLLFIESAMGLQVEAQNEENNSYLKDVKRMRRIVIDRSSSVFKRYDLLYYFSLDSLIEKSTVKKLHNLTKSIINRRKRDLLSNERKIKNNDVSNSRNDSQSTKPTNFIDILLKYTKQNEGSLETDEIREEVDTFMFEVNIFKYLD